MKTNLSIIVLLTILLNSTPTFAQVKIGDNPKTVNPSSLLELESTNKGLLLPRLTDTTSIANPPQGMLMFNNKDTSLYFRRLGGWRRMAIGEDNYWTQNSEMPQDIFTAKTVLINNSGNSSLVNPIAPFQTRGLIGNTLATFGDGGIDNTAGISLVGNWPGVFFNCYYNKSNINMAPGYSGNISFDPNAGNYWFSFNNKSTTANTGVNQTTELILSNQGQLGINAGPTVPTRAWIEEHGAIHNAAAIFGDEGSGVAIEEHWPSIGLNSYYNGSGLSSIGAGYSAEIGIDQNNGDFYLTTATGKSVAGDQAYGGVVRTFNVSPLGNVGINTMNPESQIEINQTIDAINPANGITFTSHENQSGTIVTNSFNISGFTGLLNGDIFDGSPYLVFQTTASGNGGFTQVANIDLDGNYHQTSDARFKKDIASLDQNDMLQKLLLLKPSNYHFINEKSNYPRSYGFLAQDVEQVFPEFVNELQGKKMLAYSSFIPVIVSAVQEQQQEITNLKTEKSTNPEIQKEIDELKKQCSVLPAVQRDITDMQNQISILPAVQKNIDELQKGYAVLPAVQREIADLQKQTSTLPAVQKETDNLKNQVSILTEIVKQLQQKVDALQKQVK